jgi:carbon monoxide dehydrogenase subunit G
MKVTGSATIGHSVGDVYAALTDPAVLVRTLPGCQRLEQTGPDSYTATLQAGVGSIKGLFDGSVRLTDMTAPDSFTLHASGAGTPGTVDAVAHVRLVADPMSGGTLVHYAADATVGGVIGGVGQRMLSGVARRTAGEFFAAVDRDLAAAAAPVAVASVVVAPGVTISTAIDDDPSAVRTATPAPTYAQPEPRVWTRPAPAPEPDRQRIRDITLAAVFGAAIALLGVLLGALVAGW